MCVFNCSDFLYLEVAASRHVVIPRGEGGLLYETDGDARRLA